MIARGDPIGGAAIGDCGRRTLASEWQGPALPLPTAGRKPRRRHIARR